MQVELVLTVFPPPPEGAKRKPKGYVKRFRGETLEQAKSTADHWLDTNTEPGTRVIELTAHYVGEDEHDDPIPL